MKPFATFTALGRYGRFANQMFQIAGTIGVSLSGKNGVDFKFPLWINHDHKERFGSDEPVDIYNHLVNPLTLLTEEDERNIQYDKHVHWGYHEVIITGNTALYGHFQSFAFAFHKKRVRMVFKV